MEVKVMLSVILPAFNEEKMINKAAAVISGILDDAGILHEIIFADDGSSDDTWSQICEASQRYENVRGVHFSRNFGKEAAIMAGLKSADGDCCAVLDCDLQHPPEKLVEMYRLWENGYEVIEGIKESRGKEKRIMHLSADIFYSCISRLSGLELKNSSDYKLIDRKVVDVLLSMPERSTFFRAMTFWAGFRSTSVTYCVNERTAGETKWSPVKLAGYAVKNITSFSAAPMQLVTWSGMIFLVIAVIMGIHTLWQKVSGNALDGFTTVIMLQLITSSLIMISIGITGYYIARIYDEIKHRPRYIISEECGTKKA
jgi:dolichol-phosphate mannosyltransferase